MTIEIAKPGADIGIVIADAEAQLRFYGEALGLPYLGAVSLPNGTLHMFACGDSLLKLYHLPATNPEPRAEARGSRIGLSYFTINVRDVDKTLARLERHGVHVAQAAASFDAGVELPAPAGKLHARYAMVTDAEGNFVELLQRLS